MSTRKDFPRATIEALISRNLTDAEIAKELGCSLRHVPTLRRRHGFAPRPTGRPVGRINPPEVRAQIVATARRNREQRA